MLHSRTFVGLAREIESVTRAALPSLVLALIAAWPAAGQTPKDPLDPLTAPEYWTIYDAMRASGHLEAKARITMAKKRGITDLTTVICAGVSVGNYGTPEEQGRRIQGVIFLDRHGVWESFARPIEGLTVMWDADAHKALSVMDTGVVPVPQAPANFGAGEAGPL